MKLFSQTRIRTRILLSLLGLTVVALIIFAAISFVGMRELGNYATELNQGLGQEALRVSKQSLENLARDGVQRITVDQANLFDAEFRAVETQLNLMAAFAESLGNAPPRSTSAAHENSEQEPRISNSLETLFKTIPANNTLIADVVIGTPNGQFRHFVGEGSPAPGFDARKLEWYKRAVATGKPGWSDPAPGAVDTNLRITCSMPVYNRQHKLLAVIGIDVALKTIRERIIRTQLNDRGDAILLDQNRKIIARSSLSSGGEILQKAEYFRLDKDGEERKRLEEALLAGKSGITRGVFKQRDSFIAYAPVATTKWSVLLILPLEEVNAPIRPTERSISSQLAAVQTQVNTKISLSLIILTFCFCIMTGVVILVARRVSNIITAPILTLEEGAKIIGEGNLDHRLEVYSGDEIEQLAGSFNKMTTDLQTYIRNLTETTAAKERIQGELKVATDIQASLLPRIFPPFPDRPEFSIYAMMDPAKEVGGDFYDFFFIDDTHLFFVIADVSDKGVPAALYMMVSKTLIKTEALRKGTPDEILRRVNDLLYPDNETMMFVTVFCAILDTETGVLSFSNAGHNPPLLRAVGEAAHYMDVPQGIVLGVMPDAAYATTTITMKQGDIILLYTDGVTEAMNISSVLYGEERLNTMFSSQDSTNVSVIIHAVREDILTFIEGAKQSDDITMVALMYNGKNRPAPSVLIDR